MEAKDLRILNLIYEVGLDYIGENPVPDRNDLTIVKVNL